MSKSYLSIVTFSILFCFLFSFSNNVKTVEDQTFIEVDFLLNESDLERYGLYYAEPDEVYLAANPNLNMINVDAPAQIDNLIEMDNSSLTSSPQSSLSLQKDKTAQSSTSTPESDTTITASYSEDTSSVNSVCVIDSDRCISQEITITEKHVNAVAVKDKSSVGKANFDFSNYGGERQGRVGLLSSQKWIVLEQFEGTATITITPRQLMELDEAKVYANKNGLLDLILKDSKGVTVGSINEMKVNPGSSIVYLTDMAFILKPGEKYTLTVEPSNAGSGLQLENSLKCSPSPLKSEVVDVNYNKHLILYDLRFYD